MLINIQFLRFAAAVLVLLFHGAEHVVASGHAPGLLFRLGQVVGHAGVDIFFVISGFIMVWTTVDASGGQAAFSFARRRLARIYSGYWPFFLIALIQFSWIAEELLADVYFLRAFFLWPTPMQNLLLPISWTLIYEMCFYFLFTLVVLGTTKRRTAVLWALTLSVAGWVLYSQLVRHSYNPGQFENLNNYERYLAYPYLLEFMAGALLAVRLKKKPGGHGLIFLVTGLALLTVGGWINIEYFAGDLVEGYFIFWRVLIFGSASVFLVAGLVRIELGGRQLPKRFSMLLGGASYAIYLSHILVLDASYRFGLLFWLSKQGGWLSNMVYLWLLIAIVGFSVVFYVWIERPLHHSFRRWLRV